jgi:hypothetical protein
MLISLVRSFSDDIRAQEETKEWAKWHADFLPDDEEPLEPVSDYFYPIVDDLRRVKVAGAEHYNPAEHRLVGVVAASIYWRAMIRYDGSSCSSKWTASIKVIVVPLTSKTLLQECSTTRFQWHSTGRRKSVHRQVFVPNQWTQRQVHGCGRPS